MPRVGLEGTDELQVEAGRVLEKLRELLRRAHFGQPILAALFGGFDGDVLPFGLLLRGALVIDLDDGAIGHDGRDFGSADLNGFLHDEVHVFPFRNGLGKGDAAGKRRGRRFVQSAETNLGAIDGGDLGGHLAAVAVEEDELCRRALGGEHRARDGLRAPRNTGASGFHSLGGM